MAGYSRSKAQCTFNLLVTLQHKYYNYLAGDHRTLGHALVVKVKVKASAYDHCILTAF